MNHIVVSHHHDPNTGVYRLVIGIPVYDEVITDDNDGEPEHIVVGYDDVRDYVFADDDPRWEGKTEDEIGAEQRAIVVDALTAPDAEPPAAETKPMPGVGEAL